MHWIALIVGLLANVGANLTLKVAVQNRGDTPASIMQTLTGPWLWVGLGLASVLLVSYLYAIKTIPVSVAYPIATGGAMVGIALAAWWLLGEPLPVQLVLGICMTVVGVALIAMA